MGTTSTGVRIRNFLWFFFLLFLVFVVFRVFGDLWLFGLLLLLLLFRLVLLTRGRSSAGYNHLVENAVNENWKYEFRYTVKYVDGSPVQVRGAGKYGVRNWSFGFSSRAAPFQVLKTGFRTEDGVRDSGGPDGERRRSPGEGLVETKVE